MTATAHSASAQCLFLQGAFGRATRLIRRIAVSAGALASVPAAKRPALSCIGRLSLGGSKTVSVVEFEAARFLIVVSADSIACVHAIAPSGAPPSTSPGRMEREGS